jgi:hypothetical protein
VADALERHYLRKVFFGFSRDREGKDLLEEVRRGALFFVGACLLVGCCQLVGAGCWVLLGPRPSR